MAKNTKDDYDLDKFIREAALMNAKIDAPLMEKARQRRREAEERIRKQEKADREAALAQWNKKREEDQKKQKAKASRSKNLKGANRRRSQVDTPSRSKQSSNVFNQKPVTVANLLPEKKKPVDIPFDELMKKATEQSSAKPEPVKKPSPSSPVSPKPIPRRRSSDTPNLYIPKRTIQKKAPPTQTSTLSARELARQLCALPPQKVERQNRDRRSIPEILDDIRRSKGTLTKDEDPQTKNEHRLMRNKSQVAASVSVPPKPAVKRSRSPPSRSNERSLSPPRTKQRLSPPEARHPLSPPARSQRAVSPIRNQRPRSPPLRNQRPRSPPGRSQRAVSPIRNQRPRSPPSRNQRPLSPPARSQRAVSPIRNQRQRSPPPRNQRSLPSARNQRAISPPPRPAPARKQVSDKRLPPKAPLRMPFTGKSLGRAGRIPKRKQYEEDDYDDLDGFVVSDDEDNDYSHEIKNLFKYNKNRFYDENDSDEMEMNVRDIIKEEKYSEKIAKQEDKEEEEKEARRIARIKKRRSLK